MSREVEDVYQRLTDHGLDESAEEHASEYGVTIEEMLGRSKRRAAAYARRTYWAWLRDNYEYSYPDLGELFLRHHTTVLAGVEKVRSEG